MIKVAHTMDLYLGQTETFIWQYLSNFEQTYPIIVAEHLKNLDQFLLPGGKIYQSYGPRFTKSWFIDNWYRRVLKKPSGYKEKIIYETGASLIHAHYGPIGCKYLPVSLSLNIPLITNFYGYDISIKDIINQNKLAYSELFKNGSRFLVEGSFMRSKLISLGCPEEKINIQRIAIEIESYRFRKRLWDGHRPIRLLFVGRFVEKKGLEYALQALSMLKTKYSFQFRIIGGGELEKNVQRRVRDLDLSNDIIWLGVQPHRKVIEEIENCDILIQPSVTATNGDSEGGAPTILLEAQACGAPIISTTHADIPNITRQDKSALLSSERDVDGLLQNICYLFENPERWPIMGEEGRKFVKQYHDILKESKRLEALYKSVM